MAQPTKQPQSPGDRINKYVKEWQKWRQQLKPYWLDIDKQQEMYEFYKREGSETSSDISLNNAFAIVESQVARANDTTLTVTVSAMGDDGISPFDQYVATVLKDAIEDKRIAQIKGSFRKVKEMFFREFLIKGNAVAEVQYCYASRITNGTKHVVADNPYTMVLPYKTYIFNPSMTFDNTNRQYLEKYVSMDYLKDNQMDDKTGKGIYKNLSQLQSSLQFADDENNERSRPYEDDRFISGDKRIPRKVENIQLLEVWEGAKLIVIANQKVIIREENDPKKIGWSGIVTAMNYKLEGRPYAYGEIASIYKPIRAQDTIMNQSIEIVNKYLRPSILVADPDADLDAIIEVMESGGVTYGNAQGVAEIPTTPPPSSAFQTIDSIQQSIERAARWSPYSDGNTSSASDKTQGTFHGIKALQNAAEPNLQVKLDAIEESFMEPLANIYLPMIANLMGEDEVRYGLMKGKKTEWVKATKGILLGNATIDDLLTVGIIQQDDIQDLIMQVGLDPQKELEKTVVFEVDWLINVKLNNQSQADKIQEAQKAMAMVQFGQQLGVMFKPEQTWTTIAEENGVENPEEMIMSVQEREQTQQQQMQQQAQMEQQANQKPPVQAVPKAPSEMINFKDLPPKGKAQLAQQAGIDLTEEDFIQHDLNQHILGGTTPPQPIAPQAAMMGAPSSPGGF